MEKIYHIPTQKIVNLTNELKLAIKENNSINEYKKILALPEHFSPEQLQMIVESKLQDGDELMVECEKHTIGGRSIKDINGIPVGYESYIEKRIKLNQKNHVNIIIIHQQENEHTS